MHTVPAIEPRYVWAYQRAWSCSILAQIADSCQHRLHSASSAELSRLLVPASAAQHRLHRLPLAFAYQLVAGCLLVLPINLQQGAYELFSRVPMAFAYQAVTKCLFVLLSTCSRVPINF